MKSKLATWSDIGEKQTISLNCITDRISIRHRRWQNKEQIEETKDVLVDGCVYTPDVSDAWIFGAIGAIMQLVSKKGSAKHIGMGQWL